MDTQHVDLSGLNLPTLEGSEKQVKWAQDIRRGAICAAIKVGVRKLDQHVEHGNVDPDNLPYDPDDAPEDKINAALPISITDEAREMLRNVTRAVVWINASGAGQAPEETIIPHLVTQYQENPEAIR